jgi:L-threonylcarbamoyladenylate synthase
MPVLVKGLDDAERLAQVSVKARRLAEKFWPGPLTIIFPALKILPRRLVPNDTVGLRSPNHPICLNLLGLCSGALVGTSANLTGQPPAISADQASRDLGGRVELVLDGGPTPMGIASTVVDLTKPKVRIIREGPIGKTDIMKCLRAT